MNHFGRWQDAQAALGGIAQVVKDYDSDGIDIYFLNSSRSGKGLKVRSALVEILLSTANLVFRRGRSKSIKSRVSLRMYSRVVSIFQFIESFSEDLKSTCDVPGETPTATKLAKLLDEYLKEIGSAEQRESALESNKPVDFIVITDGKPSDGDKLESVIIDAARKLKDKKWPVGQVGIQFVQIGNDAEAQKVGDQSIREQIFIQPVAFLPYSICRDSIPNSQRNMEFKISLTQCHLNLMARTDLSIKIFC